jgi:hypothetical protein
MEPEGHYFFRLYEPDICSLHTYILYILLMLSLIHENGTLLVSVFELSLKNSR